MGTIGPGDPYVYRYYDDNYQPQYFGSTTIPNVDVTNIVNYNVPGAVTVVRTTEFIQVVSPGAALTADSGLLAQSRPVLDPYEVPKIKELAPRIRSHGQRVYVPDTADLALNRTVVTSQEPILPAVAGNKARTLKAKSVPEAEGKRKLQITKKEQPVIAIRPDGVAGSCRRSWRGKTRATAARGAAPSPGKNGRARKSNSRPPPSSSKSGSSKSSSRKQSVKLLRSNYPFSDNSRSR